MLFLVSIIAGSLAFSGCSGGKANGGADGRTAAGSGAPPVFDFPTLGGGETVVRPGADSKPLLIVFFASWCKACAEEVPEINRIYSEYAERGVISLYAINIGDPPAVVEGLVKKREMKYPVLLDERQKTLGEFKIVGLPMNILYDADGAEVYRHAEPPGEDVLGKVLAK